MTIFTFAISTGSNCIQCAAGSYSSRSGATSAAEVLNRHGLWRSQSCHLTPAGACAIWLLSRRPAAAAMAAEKCHPHCSSYCLYCDLNVSLAEAGSGRPDTSK